MAKFYQLRPATRIEGIVPPALDARYVKNKEHLFSRKLAGSNKFHQEEIIFDYLVPISMTHPDEKDNINFITDFHQWFGEYPRNGYYLVISKHLKELLSRYNLYGVKFYPAFVLFKDQKFPYYVMQILKSSAQKLINYKHSVFNNLNHLGELSLEKKETKQFNSFSELDEYQATHWTFNWNYESLYLDAELEEVDLMLLPSINVVISSRLKKALEVEKISSIICEPLSFPIHFGSND